VPASAANSKYLSMFEQARHGTSNSKPPWKSIVVELL
jgi:hypothetical protein